MKVTNISDRQHRYVFAASGRVIQWASGETRDVPEQIGWEVVEAHPFKMQLHQDEVNPPDENPAADAAAEAQDEEQTEESEETPSDPPAEEAGEEAPPSEKPSKGKPGDSTS